MDETFVNFRLGVPHNSPGGGKNRNIFSSKEKAMNKMDFIKGIGIGAAAGTAMGILLAPKKKNRKNMAGKALKAAGDIVENLTGAMGG